MSIAHQKNAGPDIFFRRPFPVRKQNLVYHQAGFTFAPEEKPQRLGYKVLPGQAKEYADGVDQFAYIGNTVCDGDSTGYFNDIVSVVHF